MPDINQLKRADMLDGFLGYASPGVTNDKIKEAMGRRAAEVFDAHVGRERRPEDSRNRAYPDTL
ncbi:MAG: hypothetical protein HY314_10290 [Acidobacteria bacterium]|nr:hypothetical protein [Acidobacteriota bacterium]